MVMRFVALGLWLVMTAAVAPAAVASEITVLSFNVWGAGANERKPIRETVAVIRRTAADLVGVQETRTEGNRCTTQSCPPQGPSRARALARALGLEVREQTAASPALWSNAVLSRWPIRRISPNGLGVEFRVDGRSVWLFNIHLDDAPYQPYQLLRIKYGPYPFLSSERDAIDAARRTRGPALKLLEDDLAEAKGADLVLITGDFNEPSHRDWTFKTAAIGRHPIRVRYPFTRRLEHLGFVDTFRAVYPNPVAKPGRTWTPTSKPSDRGDHHDRIDFVFARGKTLRVLDAGIVGERAPEADIVVRPWPSDHRASFARLRF